MIKNDNNENKYRQKYKYIDIQMPKTQWQSQHVKLSVNKHKLTIINNQNQFWYLK